MRVRFAIRDLIWLTLVVATFVAWRLEVNRMADDHATSDAFMLSEFRAFEKAAHDEGYYFKDDGTGTKMLSATRPDIDLREQLSDLVKRLRSGVITPESAESELEAIQLTLSSSGPN